VFDLGGSAAQVKHKSYLFPSSYTGVHYILEGKHRVCECSLVAPANPGFILKQDARAGDPAAPRISSLPLLPLGPDGVRRFLPRRTHPDMPRRIPQDKLIVNVPTLNTPGFE
jgi:hypothetical protein